MKDHGGKKMATTTALLLILIISATGDHAKMSQVNLILSLVPVRDFMLYELFRT